MPYYERSFEFAERTRAKGEEVRSEFDAVQQAFNDVGGDIDRALKLPLGESIELPDNPSDRANKVIGFNASGNIELQAGAGTWRGNYTPNTDYDYRDIFKDAAGILGQDNIYIVVEPFRSTNLTTDSDKIRLMVDVGAVYTATNNAVAAQNAAQTARNQAQNQADRAELEADRATSTVAMATETAVTQATEQADRSTNQANRANTQANRAETEADRAETEADRANTQANRAESVVTAATETAITEATTQANRANTQANRAESERNYAQEWAQQDNNVPVSAAAGGNGSNTYSAKHWSWRSNVFANQARNSADEAAASAAEVESKKLNWIRGGYQATRAYQVNDAFSHGGSSYIVTAPTTGNAPPNPAYYDVLASIGLQGPGSGDMLSSNNLSDVTNIAQARDNLGLEIYALLNDTRSIKTTGQIAARKTALTNNDSQGNANVTFNHTNGVPEQDGTAGRITVETDASGPNPSMIFSVIPQVLAGERVDANNLMSLRPSGLYWKGTYKFWHADNDGDGSGLDADVMRGMAPSPSPIANTVVSRNSSGDSLFRQVGDGITNTTPNFGYFVTKVNLENNSWYRSSTPEQVASALNQHLNANNAQNLNGQPGSYYRNASNLNAGKVPIARIPGGQGSGLNADLLRAKPPSPSVVANTIAERDGQADIQARLFRSNFSDPNPNVRFIMTKINHSDNNYIRPSTPAQVAAALNPHITAANSNQLGGQNSAFYRNASNLNAGTIPAARLPAINASTLGGQNLATIRNASNLNAGTLNGARMPMNAGGVGTYVMAVYTLNTTGYYGLGNNLPGSQLRPSNAFGIDAMTNAPTLQGTWKCMGKIDRSRQGLSQYNQPIQTSLFVRIS